MCVTPLPGATPPEAFGLALTLQKTAAVASLKKCTQTKRTQKLKFKTKIQTQIARDRVKTLIRK